MGGKLAKKQGSTWRGDRVDGDPKGTMTARQEKKKVAREVEKALAAHPCGECSACCTVKQVAEIMKPAGVACPNLGRQSPTMEKPSSSGCRIYAKRPESCRNYNCLYRVGLFDFKKAKSRAEHRPDKLGIVFDFEDTHAVGIPLVVAREVWAGAIQTAMPLLHELAGQGHVMYLIEQSGREFTMGPEEKVIAIKEAARRKLPIVLQ